jgi:hypothetical protein
MLTLLNHAIIEPNGFSHLMIGSELKSFLSAPSNIWPGGG